MKVPNKDAAKKGTGSKEDKSKPKSPSSSGQSSGTPRGDDIPPLETAPPDEPPPEDDSRSDEDFVPDEDFEPKPKSKRDKKVKKEPSSKRSKSKTKEIKSPPPKSPKALHKKLTDKDIDDIMARVAGMKDEEPIMVMRYGALLTGVAAPRKNNLRKFLEENRVGAKVMLDDEPKSSSKPNSAPRRRDDMIISNRNRLEKAKRQAERARPIQPVAPIIRESPKSDPGSKSTLNPYARKEENQKATEKKDKPIKKEKKEVKKERDDEDEISGKDLMKLIRKAQKKEKSLEKKEKLAEKMDIALTPTRDGKTKRSGSVGDHSSRDGDGYSHPKKMRRSSDNSTPTRPGSRTPEQADRTPEGQRHKARKMLRDILTQRSQNSDLKMDLQSITKLVAKIERSLYQKYQQPNKQYMAKFRQINFNLKDPQNDFFWRKVITGEIGSADLHEMSNMDMASNDLMEARKQQEKEHLDKIKRLEEERQKEALKPTAKITHKGEIEIENFEEPLEKTNDFGVASDISLNVSTKEEKKDKKERKKKDKKRRAETKISKAEEDTINRMIAQKPKLTATVEEPVVIETENTEVDESQGLESPKTPDYYPDDDRDIPESPGTPDEPETISSPQHMTPPPPTSDDNDDVKDNSSSIAKVWSGKLSFPEATSFNANGYIISGTMDIDMIKHSLPERLNVAGRLDISAAEKYITEVRQASDVNRISIMSLYGKSVNEQTGYSDSLFYLTSKNKVGVVNNFRGVLKDVYLVPLRENEKIPSFMEPFNGIGLSEQHPAILLALLVRKSEKKKVKPKPIEKKEKKEELEYVPQEPVKIQSISNELFNTIRESLNNPSLGLNPPPTTTMNPPPEPPPSSDFISANIAPPAQDSYNEQYHDSYRPDREFDRRDNRDRDRRTFASSRSDYEPQRTSHWDNNRRDDYRREDRRKNDRGSYRSNRRY